MALLTASLRSSRCRKPSLPVHLPSLTAVRNFTNASAIMDLSTFIPLAKFIAIVWPTLYAGITTQCAPPPHHATSY